MALPVFRRFAIGDYPQADDWAGQMFVPLNLFCEQTVAALNKNLAIGENVIGMKYTVTFTTPADYITNNNFTPIVFTYNGNGRPDCLLIGSIKRSDGVLITSTPMITSWKLNTNTNPFEVIVSYIAGLDHGKTYTVTLLLV